MSSVWLGGGNNHASNSKLWSNGVPVAGESLSVETGTNSPGPFTMNVSGNDLAGDIVSVAAILTANLSTHAVMAANVTGGQTAATLNLSGGDTVSVNAGFGGSATVNMVGNNTATIGANRASATVNLASGAIFTGTILGGYAGHVTVNGGGMCSSFNNNGNSEADAPGGSETVNVAVIGKGIFAVDGGNISFLKAVGPNQSVNMEYGSIAIYDPADFHASVTLSGGLAQISLSNMAAADSYSFENGLLDIWSGNSIIDALKLTNNSAAGYGFLVEPPTGTGSLLITTVTPGSTFPASLPTHA